MVRCPFLEMGLGNAISESRITLMQHPAQQKIQTIIADYKRLFPSEYTMTLQAVDMHRKMIDGGAETTEGSDMMPMYEVSETLQFMFSHSLTSEEATWFKSRAGGRWFIKEYPQFSLQ